MFDEKTVFIANCDNKKCCNIVEFESNVPHTRMVRELRKVGWYFSKNYLTQDYSEKLMLCPECRKGTGL